MQNWNGKRSVNLASLPTSCGRDIFSRQDFLQLFPHGVVSRVVVGFHMFVCLSCTVPFWQPIRYTLDEYETSWVPAFAFK